MIIILADSVGLIACCAFIAYLWRLRTARLAMAMSAVTACSAIWIMGQLLEIVSSNLSTKLLCLKLGVIGAYLLPVAGFLQVAIHCQANVWLTRGRILLLSLIPILTLSMVWTNQYHGLWISTYELNPLSMASTLSFSRGPWYWISLLYSYGLILVAVILLLQQYRSSQSLYQWQVVLAAPSLLIPILANFLFQLRVFPLLPDLTPSSLIITVTIFLFLIFRFRFLNVIPIAQRTIFENLTDGVIVLNNDGFIVDCNSAARSLLNLASHRSVGYKVADLSPWWSERIAESMQRATEKDRIVCFESNQTERWLEIQTSPLELPIEGDNSAIVMIRDITAEKQQASELARAYEEAMDAANFRSQLLAKVSHELRNPLSVIVAFAELMKSPEYENNKEKRDKATSTTLSNAKFLTQLVNDLLDSAQLENGKFQLQEVPFSLAQVMQHVYNNLDQQAHDKGIELSYRIAPELPNLLIGDPDRITQILLNLAGNAIKFTESGYVQINFDAPSPSQWMIQVMDTGPGIPDDAQATIFEPFQQLQLSWGAQKRGYGLGLSIVKQLIQLMHGEIQLDSQVGNGSTFTILLPLNSPATLKRF